MTTQLCNGVAVCPTRVSIVMPAYNAETYIGESIESVLAQTYLDWELLVVDDCSTDSTVGIVEGYARNDERIKLLRAEQNGGPARARNRAIDAASGRFISFLDADDLWHPKKLARQLAWMAERKVALCYHDYRHLSADGSLVGRPVKGPDRLDWHIHHCRRGVGCLSIVVDRAHCPDPRFPEDLGPLIAEDFVAWSRVLRQGVVGYRCPEDLGLYRILPRSRSSRKLGAAQSIWRIYRDVEQISLVRAGWWWLRYVADATRIHVVSRPRGPSKFPR